MTDYVSKEAFAAHAENEERNQKVTNDALHEGNIRMGNIEANIVELTTDLKPLKALYHAVVGAGSVVAVLIALLVFIYNQDRDAIMKIADTISKHGVAIEKMIQSHAELEKDTTKEFQRIERALEKVGK